MKKYRKEMIAAGVALFLLAALGVFLCVWFFGARYPEFDETARAEDEIPGLGDGFCPQGICSLPAGGKYRKAVSGYLKNSPSRLYLLGEETKYVVLEEDGKPLTTHFGGVTCTGNFLLVASGKRLVRVSLSDVIGAENGGSVEVKDSFQTGLSNAFCYYFGGTLYAGEFYRKGNYETELTHHIEKDGETNYAFVYAFGADEEKEGGVKSTVPEKIVSVPALVQGFAVYEGGIALSTSYGLPDSAIYFHKNVLLEETAERFELGGNSVPLYRLDGSTLKSKLTAPCMSEEIYEEGGRLYILFESKANKYKYFVRRQTETVFSVPVR